MKKFLKFAVSLLIITLVVSNANFTVLRKGLESISFLAAGAIIVTYFVGQVLSLIKWWLIINIPAIPIFSIFKYYFFGMFTNYFGLGLVGGDVARSVLLISNHQISKSKAFGSVLVDRIHGLAILALIGTVAQVVNPNLIQDVKLIFLSPAILIGITLFLVFIKTFNISIFGKYAERIENFRSNIPNTFSSIFKVSFLSFLSHGCQILIHYFIAISLGLDIPITIWFIAVPVVNLLSSLPIAWNGLGVREFSYAYLLAPSFLSKEQAVVFGAIWLFANLVNSAIGGLFSFSINGNKENISEKQIV